LHTTTNMAGAARGPGSAARSVRAQLFERVMGRVYRYFVKVVWDPHAVDDCLQKTLLRLERSLTGGTYDPQQSFNRWMWIKAHSVLIDHLRTRGRAPGALPPEELAAGTSLSPASAVDARLDAETILARLRELLPPETLAMFVMRYDEGSTVREIAEITGRDPKTVRKRLERARREALRLLGEPSGS